MKYTKINPMKKLLFLLVLFYGLKVNSQNYLISFTGTGASATVSTIKVENLNKGTSLTLSGGDILHLTTPTDINPFEEKQSPDLRIYPNPMNDNSTLEIFPPVAGDAIISVLDIAGKQVARIQSCLENYRQDFKLSGVKTGLYLVNVKGSNYQFSLKLISIGKSTGTVILEKNNSITRTVDDKSVKTETKGMQDVVYMAYTEGDRLKFTGMSGNYSTVKTDIPTSDKTITFNFIACTDADNNNYPVVEIGSQLWMAENLKVKRYRNGDPIPCVTGGTEWENLVTGAYSDYDNNPGNGKTYGRLYNWFCVTDDRKLCPAGWHLPSVGEWTTLITYLGNCDAGGKLKETGTAHWRSPNTGATNECGFTALPSGLRVRSGSFYSIGDQESWWSSTLSVEYTGYALACGVVFDYSQAQAGGSGSEKQTGSSVRCLQGELVLPTSVTSAITAVTNSTASSGGYVTHSGVAAVTSRGVCWSTSANPTVANSKTTDGTGTGIFTSLLTGLTENTAYHLKAYATNSLGTDYGNELIFTTYSGRVTDVDGNVYNTKTIGTQEWMAENLRTTRYNSGDLIGTTIPARLDIRNEVAPKYQWAYGGNEAFATTRGRLYTWYAAMDSRSVCPAGWHVPTDAEWKTLEMYLGMTIEQADSTGFRGTNQGTKLKSTAIWTELSRSCFGTERNSSGFTAQPVGFRRDVGSFESGNGLCFFWSYTVNETDILSAWARSLGNESTKVSRTTPYTVDGLSVRCLKDN
jgi:uncharacterized protein (TIGR02145 family)